MRRKRNQKKKTVMKTLPHPLLRKNLPKRGLVGVDPQLKVPPRRNPHQKRKGKNRIQRMKVHMKCLKVRKNQNQSNKVVTLNLQKVNTNPRKIGVSGALQTKKGKGEDRTLLQNQMIHLQVRNFIDTGYLTTKWTR